jgi:hypothetical protein
MFQSSRHRRTFLLTGLFALITWVTGRAAELPLKVLFVGNSYTYVNDLPSLVSGLADAAGGRKIQTDQYVVGGYTLEQQAKDKKALAKIRERQWDIVVLQENSLQPILNRESMNKYARVLDAEIKRRGAKTVLYLTWARQNIPQMQEGAESSDYAKPIYQMAGAAKQTGFEQWRQQRKPGLAGGLNGAYFDIAKELHAQVVPVGIAWKNALAQDPKLVLHQADRSHPAFRGSYLAACVFYATLLDKSPVGLPGELTKGGKVLGRVEPGEARMFQEIAWQAVHESKRRQSGER